MIDPQNGNVTVGLFAITPYLRRDDFIGSQWFSRGEFTNPQRGWYTAVAKPQCTDDREFAINLLFHGNQLAAIHITSADPRFGTGWDDWSQSPRD
jgi:hypothetical protein